MLKTVATANPEAPPAGNPARRGPRPLPPAPTEVRVCNGPRCSGKGAQQLPIWLSVVKQHSGSTAAVDSCDCLGECEFGPNLQLVPSGKVCNRTKKMSDVARALSLRLPEEILEDLQEKAALQGVQATGVESEISTGSSNAQLILAMAKQGGRDKLAAAETSTTAVKLTVCQGSTCSKHPGAQSRIANLKAIVGEKAACAPGECMGACKFGPNVGVTANAGAAGGRVDGMSPQERMSGCFIGIRGEEEMQRLWTVVESVSDMPENQV
eukprot:CAMPEP_0114235912 /NCGR_PEP_ID=MMETSP0058-20121206/6515_1 /TAXON_ID=36894 /ORGANISM="Pyramimonas parkeae, CCMP726" /LENGTH=266 /DNA_ID=CAMNT_0001347729 /DNA_START=125 /DNA_END=925 /DNA_ORIENTATION=+